MKYFQFCFRSVWKNFENDNLEYNLIKYNIISDIVALQAAQKYLEDAAAANIVSNFWSFLTFLITIYLITIYTIIMRYFKGFWNVYKNKN